ncbi:MAG TPA: cation:proton antiporter [Nitrososphaeraceae archaeon]|nr:cation:proton antiporter [Nitrososphaeraceae archaeon]
MVVEIGPILQDFTIIMVDASIMAMISCKLKQPMVIGFIIACMIIGPYIPPFSLILNFDILNLFAEIGVILLLFVVGMEFPIDKISNPRAISFIQVRQCVMIFHSIFVFICLQTRKFSIMHAWFIFDPQFCY